MNVVIFVTYEKRQPQYHAVCQCGRRHGPYLKVALIPPRCQACDQQVIAHEKKAPAPRARLA